MKTIIQYALLLSFLFILPFNLLADCDPGESTPACDSAFLRFFYQVHDGDDWTNSWDLTQPMASWYGITVDDEGFVSKIDLSNNNLSRGSRTFRYGEHLTRLEELNLSNNTIRYIVLQEEYLHNLKKIDLSNNVIESIFPYINLYRIPSLEYLDVSRNNITRELSTISIRLWENMEHLDLSINRIPLSIPEEISELKNLKTLKLNHNEILGEIPRSIGELSKLEHLDLSNNELEGEVPVEISQLGQLEKLYLANNFFTGCLDENLMSFCSLPFNEEPDATITHGFRTINYFIDPGFNMLGNQLLAWEGDIRPFCDGESQVGAPCANYNLQTTEDVINDNCECLTDHCGDRGRAALIEIWEALDGRNWFFSFNQQEWGGIEPISEWAGVTTNDEGCVTAIEINRKNAVGVLPDVFEAFEELEVLVIRDEDISGPIPESLRHCTNLKTLILDANFEGEILPDIFENMLSLEEIDIDEVGLTGPLPASLGNCESLKILDLSDNNLSSVLPDNFDQLQNLETVQLESNQFTGPVPVSMMYCEKLKSLNLSENELDTWVLPSDNTLSSIETISLDYNKITTGVPTSINTLSTLQKFYMAFNEVPGTIPTQICDCDNLRDLGLSENNLSGNIPQCMASMNLYNVYLSTNTFTGEIPTVANGVLWPGIHNLYLDENELTGEFPTNLGMAGLTNLHIDHNQLEGDISFLSISRRMWELNFSHNNFTGTLPELLPENGAKNLINFSNNQLESPIPTSWKDIEVKHVIDLSHNNFTGEVPNFIGDIRYFIDQWNIFYADIFLNNNDFEGCVESGELNSRIDLTNNPKLAWGGDIPTNGTAGVQQQIGAPCDDGNPLSANDRINVDCSCGGQTFSSCLERDREALMSIFETTGGDQWSQNDNWGSDEPLSSWFGLETNANGCVISILLSENNLTGSLSPSISSLSELINLDISHNRMTGSLPLSITSLENIESLNFSNNFFENCIPEEYNMYCGMDIDISGNELLAWRGDISFFCAGENQNGASCNDANPNTEDDTINSQCECGQGFYSLCAVENREALMKLYEQTNGPAWVDHTNWGTDAPMDDWYGVRTNSEGCVISLDLSFNNLIGELPEEIGHLGQVDQFNLSFNELTGEIPSLQGLDNVTSVELSFNDFSGGLPLLADDIKAITVRGMNITGTLPEEWGNLASLHSITLSGNRISGNVPDSWQGMSELTNLTLSDNKLSGQLPIVLTRLFNLRDLELDNNNFSGPIPDEYGDFNSISEMDFKNNNLTGSIPISLLDLNNPHAVYMRFQNNNLEGCIPEEFTEICSTYSRRIFLEGNKKMAWEGDFDRFCEEENQIGADCDDGNSVTMNDKINADCECKGATLGNPNTPTGNLTGIYPNPTSEIIFVPSNGDGKTVKLFGMHGELIKTTTRDQINVQDIANGIYFVEFEIDGFTKVQKVVIQH